MKLANWIEKAKDLWVTQLFLPELSDYAGQIVMGYHYETNSVFQIWLCKQLYIIHVLYIYILGSLLLDFKHSYTLIS